MPESKDDVLMVGGTGYLGGKVVDHLLARGKRVRALVRPGTDGSVLENKGVRIVRGDLTKRESLDEAVAGVPVLITTAQGYKRRRKGDNIFTIDGQGNRNLIDAACKNGKPLFVFTSILQCVQADYVPHFHQKWLIEQEIEKSGLPFVILRAGSFLDNLLTLPNMRKPLEKGRFLAPASLDTRWSYVLADEMACCLAKAAFEPKALGKRIDIASNPPLSQKEIHESLEKVLGRKLRLIRIPFLLVTIMGRVGSIFSPDLSYILAMLRFFHSGKYIADTSLQQEIFGLPLSAEDSLVRLFREAGMLPKA